MIPDKAHTLVRKLQKEVPTDKLEVGQTVFVKKGEYFPADGVIAEGNTTVNEQKLTALTEVEKGPGSRVYAGTENTGSQVIVRVTAAGNDTLNAKIIGFLAQKVQPGKKSAKEKIAHLARKILRKKKKEEPEKTHALSESAIYATEAMLKKLHAVDTIVFDKTGIITTGARHVEHVVSYKPYTQQQLLNNAAALEAHSKHMTASAIVQFARSRGAAALQRVDTVSDEGGLGVSGVLYGKHVLVGPALLLQKKKIKIPKEAVALKEEGMTVVYVVVEGELVGYIALSNPVKKSAKEVISALKKKYRTVLFTGEHEETAAAIAKQIGMHEVVAGVRDANREAKLKELQKGRNAVAYVTALHADNVADVTITMGTRAAFTGDISILNGSLHAVEKLFDAAGEK